MYQNRKKQNLRATSVEIYKRENKVSNDDKKIYSRDTDNLYPLRIEGIINNSPTARRCANLMSKYIAGAGAEQDFIINRKDETINDIIAQACDSIAYQYGVYFLVKYKIDEEKIADGLHFKIGDVEVLDYVRMAKSKEDDNGKSGKYYKLDLDQQGSGFKKANEKTPYYYPFNKKREVILSQMQKDCKDKGISEPTIQQLIQNHRGQVYYLNLTPSYTYALPLVDSVYNDCDTEYRMSLYNNKQTRCGFLGKTIITKFKNDDFDDFHSDGDHYRPNPSEKDFNEEIRQSLGVEGSSDVLIIDVPASSTDDLRKAFAVENIKAQFDDKIFEALEKTTERKIMKAFNNIPEALVNAGNGALFGTNAETYQQMKAFYWEQNEKERAKLERAFKLFGYDIEIRYFQQKETKNNNQNESA